MHRAFIIGMPVIDNNVIIGIEMRIVHTSYIALKQPTVGHEPTNDDLKTVGQWMVCHCTEYISHQMQALHLATLMTKKVRDLAFSVLVASSLAREHLVTGSSGTSRRPSATRSSQSISIDKTSASASISDGKAFAEVRRKLSTTGYELNRRPLYKTTRDEWNTWLYRCQTNNVAVIKVIMMHKMMLY